MRSKRRWFQISSIYPTATSAGDVVVVFMIVRRLNECCSMRQQTYPPSTPAACDIGHKARRPSLLSDATEGLASNAQIGGQLRERDPLQQSGVVPREMLVSLGWRIKL